MTAPPGPVPAPDQENRRPDLQLQREERLRYEVLAMLHARSGGHTGVEQNAFAFTFSLGAGHAELERIVEWLERHGLIRYCGPGPVVCLTDQGAAFILTRAGSRRSIRPDDVRPDG